MDIPETSEQSPVERKSMPSWLIPTATAVAGLILGLVIGASGVTAIQAAESESEAAAAEEAAADEAEKVKTIFERAVAVCGADKQYAVVADEGLSLTIDHSGDDDYFTGVSSTELWCVVKKLQAPTSAVSHMEQTTSMDGRQTETWDNIEVSWSYHPDRGMDSVWKITEK